MGDGEEGKGVHGKDGIRSISLSFSLSLSPSLAMLCYDMLYRLLYNVIHYTLSSLIDPISPLFPFPFPLPPNLHPHPTYFPSSQSSRIISAAFSATPYNELLKCALN